MTYLRWKEGRISGSKRDYPVDLKYKTNDGRVISTNLKITDEMAETIRSRGDLKTIQIRYLPEAPEKVFLADDRDTNSGFVMLCGGILLAMGLLAGISSWQRSRQGY
jgi:hypothetical protein